MKKSRTQQVAKELKLWIAEQGLSIGARLPDESELMNMFHVSKNSVRESMRILETEGLLVTKTGPTGGVFVGAMSETKAQVMLSNYFYGKELSISDIYQIRTSLEPELVATLSGKLSDSQIVALHQQISKYNKPATTINENRQRYIDAIGFNILLADYSNNEFLRFVVRFACEMLIQLTMQDYNEKPKNQNMWEASVHRDRSIVNALIEGEAKKAHDLMRMDMVTAYRHMSKQDDTLKKTFLLESDDEN